MAERGISARDLARERVDESEREKLRTPNRQRDLSTQHAGVQSVEALAKAYEIPNYYTIHIEPSIAEYLRSLGNGEITDGVKIATQFYRAHKSTRGSGGETDE
jgi:hypothetical protein